MTGTAGRRGGLAGRGQRGCPGPVGDRVDQPAQLGPAVGERVVDAGRLVRVQGAGDQPLLLHRLQAVGQGPGPVPAASAAPPKGAAPGVLAAWSVKVPSFRRVMLYADSSTNQTAPSGAATSRASLATGVERANDATTPSRDTLEINRLGPSVYQAPPAPSTARPSGSKFSRPFAIRSIRPFRRTPIASEKSIVNHTAPSGPTATAVGMSRAPTIRYSVKPRQTQTE